MVFFNMSKSDKLCVMVLAAVFAIAVLDKCVLASRLVSIVVVLVGATGSEWFVVNVSTGSGCVL